MFTNARELIVVLVISTTVFHFARPIVLQFACESDFRRRRNVWLILSIVGFLSADPWPFILVAAPILVWANRRDSNSLALYLLLIQVVPTVPANIPLPGANGLFEIDIYRLLSILILAPAAWRLRPRSHGPQAPPLLLSDFLLLGLGVLQIIQFVQPDSPSHVFLQDSPTNAIRRAVLFFIDTFTIYYVASRLCTTRREICEALSALWLSCTIMAALALFESLRHWLLYSTLKLQWSGSPIAGFYAMRGGLLRAEVATEHPIALGYAMAMGIGLWAYLKQYSSSITRIAIPVLLWGGLLVTYSRGPWLGGLVVTLVFAAARPRGFSYVVRAAIVGAATFALALVTPLGDRILAMLPFVGGAVDSDTIVYRQRLAIRAWDEVQSHFWFGNGRAYENLQDMRQGQGIIDLVNSYADITLFYGFVGLVLFVVPILIAISKVYRWSRAHANSDLDFATLGASLAACMVGTLFMLASASFGGFYAKLFYVFTGLAFAFANRRVAEVGTSSALSKAIA